MTAFAAASIPGNARQVSAGWDSVFATGKRKPATASSRDLPLPEKMHTLFCNFQLRVKAIEEQVEATNQPVQVEEAENMLEDYSRKLVAELRSARDALRRGGLWDRKPALHEEHDNLCFCLAIWELTQEVAVSSATLAPRILHWYNRHYLEEEIPQWWEACDEVAQDNEEGFAKESSLWEPLCRLALSDGRKEVLDLLQRPGARADKSIVRVCDFLRRIPSLAQMDDSRTTLAEFRQVVREISDEAKQVLRSIPSDHPVRDIVEIYVGSSPSAFEEGRDIAKRWGRTWVEDFVYAQAWVHSDLRRPELGELVQAVARRRNEEEIDEVDQALFSILMLDIPGLLQLLSSSPDRFPTIVLTHLVDVLYFAGRVPLSSEDGKDKEETALDARSRDWHLLRHAEELLRGRRALQRCAISYLRSGADSSLEDRLRAVAEDYAAGAATDVEIEDALEVLTDLDLGAKVGAGLCRRKADAARLARDACTCLLWAGKAEECSGQPYGSIVSEFMDSMASDDLQALLKALAPPVDEADEPLEQFPPRWLLQRLQLPSAALLQPDAAIDRLQFYVQCARCQAARVRKAQAIEWAPLLVQVVVGGKGSLKAALAILEKDVEPLLCQESPPFTADEVLQLMRFVQCCASDPLVRASLSRSKTKQLRQVLGACLSRVILNMPAASLGEAGEMGPSGQKGALAFSRTLSRTLSRPAASGASGTLSGSVMMATMSMPPLLGRAMTR